jgi:biopolymer transport protein ExbB/TolQ
MDTGVIVAIAVGALILIALLVVLARRARERKFEARREEAAEHRLEGQIRGARADRQEAAAEESGARAKAEQATAREQAARARQERELAEGRHEHARQVDPDVDDRETSERRS